MGLLLAVIVHSANIQDRDGATYVLTYISDWLPRLARVIGDGGYRGKLVGWVHSSFGWTLEIVLRTADMVGFEILPKRWVVERTFAWLGRYRRLSKDYEGTTEVSEAFVYVAMIHLMLRRLAPAKPF
jgi:putative transposase